MMNIERYLIAFEHYRSSVVSMQRVMNRRSAMRERISEIAGEKIGFEEEEKMEREFERKKRILAHATRRLQKAITSLDEARLSDYLICKYIYNMKNTEIADALTYCERQIYRISREAKKQLCKYLTAHKPTAKCGYKGKRFYFTQKKRVFHRKHGPWK